MATPINSNPKQAQAASPLSTEQLLARMQANAQGEPGASGNFNAWMEKHALTPDTLQAGSTPEANKANKANESKAPEAPAREPSSTAARLLEQALNRSRQQSVAATRQAEQTAAQAAAAAQRQGSAPKTKADGSADKVKDKSSDAQGDEDEDVGSVKSSASADDSAIVSELTPPPGVKTDDAAAMMAWLASLTQGEATHGKKLALKGGGGGAEASSGTQASTAAQAGDPRLDQAQGASTPAGATPVTDTPVWQAMQPTTALLQAEGNASFKDELAAQTAKDPVGGLNAAMGMRAAPGWPMAEAAGGMRQESATLQAPVGSDTFAQALSDQLTMWVKTVPNDGPMTAELHLNPAELGPIHVKISLEGKDAQVDFAAAAVETRQAIEASMSQLTTAFQEAGLTLTGGDVSAQTSQQGFQQGFGPSDGQGRQDGGSRLGAALNGDDIVLAGRSVAAPRPGRAGGLDLYA